MRFINHTIIYATFSVLRISWDEQTIQITMDYCYLTEYISINYEEFFFI